MHWLVNFATKNLRDRPIYVSTFGCIRMRDPMNAYIANDDSNRRTAWKTTFVSIPGSVPLNVSFAPRHSRWSTIWWHIEDCTLENGHLNAIRVPRRLLLNPRWMDMWRSCTLKFGSRPWSERKRGESLENVPRKWWKEWDRKGMNGGCSGLIVWK